MSVTADTKEFYSREPHAAPAAACVPIRARDIMTRDVIWVAPDRSVHDLAQLMSARGISAVPVLDQGRLVGIVTEGDLIRRTELGTERRSDAPTLRTKGGKTAAANLGEALTRDVASVGEETTLAAIAELMEEKAIRRVPVLAGERLVGIVSRSDIIRALAARPEGHERPHCEDDDVIRYRVVETLMNIKGASAWLTTVEVADGVVTLRGTIEDEAALEPSRTAVAQTPCVREVLDFRTLLQPYWG